MGPVTVKVPYAQHLPYTLYCRGFLMDVPHVEATGDYVIFKYAPGSFFWLSYDFETENRKRKIRRSYIVREWKEGDPTEPINLPGVDSNLLLVYAARGREIDMLKKCIENYLIQDDEYAIFKYPDYFWTKLGGMLHLIYERYKKENRIAKRNKGKAYLVYKSDVLQLKEYCKKLKRKIK